MRLYRMELYKLYHNKIFRIGLFAATALLLAYNRPRTSRCTKEL